MCHPVDHLAGCLILHQLRCDADLATQLPQRARRPSAAASEKGRERILAPRPDATSQPRATDHRRTGGLGERAPGFLVRPAPLSRDPIRRLPRNAIHNLAAIVATVLPTLLATPYIVRTLGEERFGIYLLAVSVASIGGLLDMGLAPAAVTLVAELGARREDRELSRLVNSLVCSRLPIAGLVAATGLAAAPWVCSHLLDIPRDHVAEATFVVRVSVLSLVASLIGSPLASLPRAVHRYDLVSRLGMGLALSLTGATVAALALGYGLRAIALAELALNLTYLATTVAVARRVVPAWRAEFALDIKWIRRLSSFGALIALNTFTGFVLLHVNRILVGRALGPGAVPYLAIPWGVSSRVPQVVNALTEAITPVAAELTAGRVTEGLRALYLTSTRIATIAAMTISMPLFVCANELLTVWLGPAFSGSAGTTLRILAVSSGVQSLSSVPYFLLNGIGRPAAANLPTLAAAGLNLILIPLLLPEHGLPGVAFAILLGLSAQTALLLWNAHRRLGLGAAAAGAFLLPVMLATFSAVVAAQLGGDLMSVAGRLVSRTFVVVALFHGMLLVTGCYTRQDLERIRRTWTREEPDPPAGVGG